MVPVPYRIVCSDEARAIGSPLAKISHDHQPPSLRVPAIGGVTRSSAQSFESRGFAVNIGDDIQRILRKRTFTFLISTCRVQVDLAAGMPTPVTYSTDSDMPSICRSCSIRESFNAAVPNGASPIRVAVRQNVWPRWPASSRTTL